MSTWSDLTAYYNETYQVAAGWALRPGSKVFLGNKAIRRCRFCAKQEPEVSFRNVAHALPECIGNKSLFTYYECDSCNLVFGKGCENDFGNWSLPLRTMARIRGSGGVPAIKQGPNNSWRVDPAETGLDINVNATEGFWEDDEATNTLKLHLRRPPYRPVMVVKALVKMALSIMPEGEMPNFQQALDWIKPGDTLTSMIAPTPFIHTFISGPIANDLITVAILTRLRDEMDALYCFLLLVYGHDMLQIAIPSIAKDQQHYGKKLHIPRFPSIRDDGGSAPGILRPCMLMFNSPEVVRGDNIVLDMQYGQKLPHVSATS